MDKKKTHYASYIQMTNGLRKYPKKQYSSQNKVKYLGVTIIKQVKSLQNKNSIPWRNTLKKIPEDGKSSHIHASVELT